MSLLSLLIEEDDKEKEMIDFDRAIEFATSMSQAQEGREIAELYKNDILIYTERERKLNFELNETRKKISEYLDNLPSA